MPCYHPVRGYYAREANPSGKRSIVFNPKDGFVDMAVELPCGQCVGCRLERSRQWAVRCVHEARLHEHNCFLTLTFSDANLALDGSLHKEDFQKFMKRVRKRYPHKIRYFHCGEYGEQLQRPHHHAILFGHDFHDKQLLKVQNGQPMYTSKELSELWPFGYAVIGSVTFESCAYVARYIMKKVTGDKAAEHYGDKQPEYTTMSRRPGIGAEWWAKFKQDVITGDKVVIRHGLYCKPPKFYDKQLEVENPRRYAKTKAERRRSAAARSEDNTPRRLADREEIKIRSLQRLERPFEC